MTSAGTGAKLAPMRDLPAMPEQDGAAPDAALASSREESRDAAHGAEAGAAPGTNPLRALLPKLLEAVGWDGSARALAEALPHAEPRLDVDGLRDAMARLGFVCHPVPLRTGRPPDRRMLPALLVRRGASPLLLVPPSSPEASALAITADGAARTPTSRELRGALLVFRRAEDRPEAPKQPALALLRRFRSRHLLAAGVTVTIGLLAMVPPFFLMAVYDRAIPASSPTTLISLLVGAAVAILAEAALRLLRARILVDVGVRPDLLARSAVFAHLLLTPLAAIERLGLGMRAARLRQTEALRDIGAGQGASALLELPLALVFLGGIAALGGGLVTIPVIAAVFLMFLAWVAQTSLGPRQETLARAGAALQDFLAEALRHNEAIRLGGGAARWRERFRHLSGEAAYAAFRVHGLTCSFAGLGQLAVGLTGLALVGVGALRVMEGVMTAGALIAIMILGWRALYSMQAVFRLLLRQRQLRAAISGLDRALSAPREDDGLARPAEPAPIRQGRVTLSRVAFRYGPDLEPTLVGINLDIAPGEVVAITGPNGAGKTTLLRLILGLYEPQTGSVLLDGADLRHHAAVSLRQAIGYAPQDFQFFYGTIGQNLHLAMPTASDAELRAALEQAGVLDMTLALPGGLDHRVGDGRERGLSANLRGGFALASAYLRRPKLLLLDEVIDMLDPDTTEAFHRHLQGLRGTTTVVMVTHRPSTMRLADRIVVLSGGMIARSGPSKDLLR